MEIHKGKYIYYRCTHNKGVCNEKYVREEKIEEQFANSLNQIKIDDVVVGWHHSELLIIPENMRLVPLPPYSPELNPVEHIWDDLREKSFHNQVFESIEALEQHLSSSLNQGVVQS